MSGKLVKTTEVYLCDNEKQAYDFIEEVKEEATQGLYDLKKSTVENKTSKKDEAEGTQKWHCTLVKLYNFD